MSLLTDMGDRLACSPGVSGKTDIAEAVSMLGIGGDSTISVGDDCAAIPDRDGYTLFACEGMIESFVAGMPWFAGWSAVMVNLSDIAAMGGRPTAVVNALWANGADQATPILEGMRAACEAYDVPMVGGHSNLRAGGGQLAVAVMGRAKRLLTSFDAIPGDALLFVVDLRGAYHDPHPFFDAATKAPNTRLRETLSLMAETAEDGLAHAAKDVSQGGIVGTAMMLAECSGIGIDIDLDTVPKPDNDIERWLTAFPSYGYLIAMPEASLDRVASRFAKAGLTAQKIGTCREGHEVAISSGSERAVLRDLFAEPLIGCARQNVEPVREPVDA